MTYRTNATRMLAGAGAAILLLASGAAGADPHSDGLAFGKGQLGGLNDKVNPQNAQDLPFYTNNPPQAGGFGGPSLFSLGVGRSTTCKTAEHGPDSVANQECDAVNFLAKNPQDRVKIPVNPNDPIIKGIGDTINNAKPGNVTDSGCYPKTTTTPAQHETEVCNEYLVTEDKQCTMGQVVEVDAKSNYQCNITKNSTYLTNCDKVLIVQCGGGYCDTGGILPLTVSATTGSANIRYEAPYLWITHNYQTQYWVESSTFAFNIRNVSEVKTFLWEYTYVDNWIWIAINGQKVGVRANNGTPAQAQYADKFELGYYINDQNNAQYPDGTIDLGAGGVWGVERPNNFEIAENVDLKPYLRNGTNVIEFKLANGAGPGNGNIRINAQQYCPCTEYWENQCTLLEQKS